LRRIFDGGLVPGRPLREGELATRLGVSRPPIRVALGGMAAEMARGRLDALAEAAWDETAPGDLGTLHDLDVGLRPLTAARSGDPVMARENGKFLDMAMRIHDPLETVLIPSHRIDPDEPGGLRRMCRHHRVAIIDTLESGRPADGS